MLYTFVSLSLSLTRLPLYYFSLSLSLSLQKVLEKPGEKKMATKIKFKKRPNPKVPKINRQKVPKTKRNNKKLGVRKL